MNEHSLPESGGRFQDRDAVTEDRHDAIGVLNERLEMRFSQSPSGRDAAVTQQQKALPFRHLAPAHSFQKNYDIRSPCLSVLHNAAGGGLASGQMGLERAGDADRGDDSDPPFELPASALIRLLDEILASLDRAEAVMAREAQDLAEASGESSKSPTAPPSLPPARDTALRLLRADLRLKAAVLASAAGAVRSGLERAAAARSRLAAAAASLTAQVRRVASAARGKGGNRRGGMVRTPGGCGIRRCNKNEKRGAEPDGQGRHRLSVDHAAIV
jgi:hypothetical protein